VVSGSRLEVLTPATDLSLLSAAELRVAAGLADDDATQDTNLSLLGLEAAEWIAEVCGIRTAGARSPTVLAEELRETFPPAWRGVELVLARRFVDAVTVTENGAALADGTDYVVLDGRGVIQRMSSGYGLQWQVGPIVVEYTAGFSSGSPSNVPAAIKAVARDYVRMRYGVNALDPDQLRVRSETTNDLDSVSYFDAASSQGTFEEQARERLSRFLAWQVA
jgi:hypothetical protein